MIFLWIFLILFVLFAIFYKKNFFKESFKNPKGTNLYIITMPSQRSHVESFLKSFSQGSDNIYIINAIINENPVLGCTMSHLKVLEEIAKNSSDGINIVLEDDIVIKEGSRDIIDELIEKCPKDCDILYGGYYAEQFPVSSGLFIGDRNIPLIKLKTPRTTHCYIIKSEIAKKLVPIIKEKIQEPIDEIIGRSIYEGHFTAYGIDYLQQPWQIKN